MQILDPYWAMVRAFVQTQAPLQRSATSEEIAHEILALADNTYLTGQVLTLDGGLSLR